MAQECFRRPLRIFFHSFVAQLDFSVILQGNRQGKILTDRIDKTAIRDAATVIVMREADQNPHILMGQRGAKAAFMPNKFVFPGGAVDSGDQDIPLACQMPMPCQNRLLEDLRPETPISIGDTIAVAAIRELWEETGLIIGSKGRWQGEIPPDWCSYAKTGHTPAAADFRFVFRAITPPGRPRRFDARFLLIDAANLSSNLDDFSRASDELSHLQWIPLKDARRFDLPFITEVVLAEVQARLPDLSAPASVPFFKNDDESGYFSRLYGRAQ